VKYLKIKVTGFAITTACFSTWLLLNNPQTAFAAGVSDGNLSLYSDREFPAEAGIRSLHLARQKLERSPLYNPNQSHSIFVSHAAWRRAIFMAPAFYAGGVNYYPITGNVFLRSADIENNRLFGPSGTILPGARTLDYFIAHEISHTLTGQSLGAIDYISLPRWKREGYADYVAKGVDFDYIEAQRALLNNDPRMDYERSGLYWRYHLFVAHLLDRRGWSEQRLLRDPISEADVEQAIRNEAL
jgi:hypothetical protein